MDLYQSAREDLQKEGRSIFLFNRRVYPYLRFLQEEFGAERIFLQNPDVFIVGHDFPKEIVSRSFRYLQFFEGDPYRNLTARRPVIILDPDIEVGPKFPRLFSVGKESDEWDIKVDGKKYALIKPEGSQNFLLEILEDYLHFDLAELVLQYLPFSEEFMGAITDVPRPKSLAISNRSGNIYVLNADNGLITIYNPKGKLIGEFATNIENNPQGIAISPVTDNVFVTEYLGHRLDVYDAKGKFVRSWGSPGEGKGQFIRPLGIAISIKGEVYVADTMNNRIQVFDEKGGYLREWDLGDHYTYKLVYIAISQGEIYVIDSEIGQVKVFSSVGQLLRKWGKPGLEEGKFLIPSGIAISPVSNEVFVSDERTHFVSVFTKDGEYLRRIKYKTGFRFPQGIAISNKGDLYVANQGNNVLIFRTVQGLVQKEVEEEE